MARTMIDLVEKTDPLVLADLFLVRDSEDLTDGISGTSKRVTYETMRDSLSSYVTSTITPSDIGLGNVDNTSDLSKPISTATQSALDLKLSEVNLGTTYDVDSVTVTNDSGDNSVINSATGTDAGVMSVDDKLKLDGIEEGAEVNVGTDLTALHGISNIEILSSTGTSTDLLPVDSITSGLMTPAMHDKLDGIEEGAQANVDTNVGSSRDATTYTLTSSTGTGTTLEAATSTLAGLLSAADKDTLDNLAGGTVPDLDTSYTASDVTVTNTLGTDAVVNSATTSLAGVMSAADKTIVDGLSTFDPSTKQDTLVSSTNIKTINGESLLGSGDIETGTVWQYNYDPKSDETLAPFEHTEVVVSGLTMTLPPTPSEGDQVIVGVGDITDTVVARNGSNIMGIAENLTIDKPFVAVKFTYIGSTLGWRIS